MWSNALVVGDPFCPTGGGKRCFEVIKRYKKYGITPYLVTPPTRLVDLRCEDVEKLLPSLSKNGVKLIGLDLSAKFAFKKRIDNSPAWLLNFKESSALCSHFVHELLPSLREIRFDFIVGHHELSDVIQTTHEIAQELKLESAIVLQLPPFYADMRKAIRLKLMDRLNLSSLPTYKFLLPEYYRSIYTILLDGKPIRNMLREPLETIPVVKYLQLKISKQLSSIDKIFAVSRSIPYEMGDEWANKIAVLKPAVAVPEEFERIGNKEGGDFVLYFARLVPTKGVLEIPLIWKRFLAYSRRKLRLYIVGTFSDKRVEETFNAVMSKLDLAKDIEYLGYQKTTELVTLVAKAKAVIYPSHKDSISLVVSECIAQRTPVIAYDIPAIRFNYLATEGVRTVPEFEVDAMAYELSRLIEEHCDSADTRLPTWDQVAEKELSLLRASSNFPSMKCAGAPG